MLRPYTFVQTEHQKLHNFVIAFFDRIEQETGLFSLDFFDEKFRPIVKRHRKVLRESFKDIYDVIKQWPQDRRSQLCVEIRQSNDIEEVCSGAINPKLINKYANGVYAQIRKIFLKLYSNVLDGEIVRDELGVTLRQHFDDFRRTNNQIILCPMCGISHLKTEFDTLRDPYDHYLPEALYPLSSVNFYNLIPTCTDCNSPQIKGAKDIVSIRNNRLFYPYDQNHQGVEISFSIQQDSAIIDDIEWQVELESPDGKDEEVEAWKQIYNIEDRYIGFVKGHLAKWYNAYWGYIKVASAQSVTEDQKRQNYFAVLQADVDESLDFIKMPAFSEFLDTSQLERARQEAANYS